MSEKVLSKVVRDVLSEQERERQDTVWREIASWIGIILVAVAFALLVNRVLIVNAQVTSGSMKNTIQVGDRVIGLRVTTWFSEPKEGDIVFFLNPDNESEIYVKRVIGVPGDTIDIRGGTVYRNGVALEEPYLAELPKDRDFGPYEVPEGQFFMLGDNRNDSLDSRYWAHTFVAKEKILGKAYWIYYPRFESLYKTTP